MFKKASQPADEGPLTFSEADKARAGQWFKKAADLREKRDYDYAIECYITGLGYWPEAVEDGHMLLRSVAVQRQQAGGKKPGLMDGMKLSMTGKDAVKAMLNAEHLLAKDPQNGTYADGLLKNATKAGLVATCCWAAPVVLETLKRDKKPNKARFQAFRENLVEAAQKAAARGDNKAEVFLLEQAVASLDYQVPRTPGDEELRDELKHLAGRLTIAKGKYDQADDFRASLQDAESQKLLHDQDRMKQGRETQAALVAALRKDYEAAPDVPGKVYALVEALIKDEKKEGEDEAIGVLLEAYARTKNYSFKLRADDIRMRQSQRLANELAAKARASSDESDRQQARLAALEHRQMVVEIYRERVEKYPTDLKHKYRLGRALFETAEYDEAIPMLQAAQQDPRTRHLCQLMLGRAFFEKGSPAQAAEILREAFERYELADEHSKEMLYWLGRAHQAAGNVADAKDAFGRLLRQDYNYRDGDARRRLEALQ